MRTHYFLQESEQERVVAELSGTTLKENYLAIRKQLSHHSHHPHHPHQMILPMVKAEAYGHGAEWVSRSLLHFPDLYGLGVATLEEGQELRKELGAKGARTKILIFSGALPWTDEKGYFCEKYHLTPVLASDEDWTFFYKKGWHRKISYELKFNTGMNRLGIRFSYAKQIAENLKKEPHTSHPDGVLTHLALGDSPDAKLSLLQKSRFRTLRDIFLSFTSKPHFHFANSAAIWNSKKWDLDSLTDVVRPGIALYGIPPWEGAPARGIAPLLRLKASVIAIQTLKQGETVGYGATYKAKCDQKIAILSAGYADGIHRTLSNQGQAWLGGRLCTILGVISMDLCAIECPAGTKRGDEAVLVGSELDLWSQAKKAGTIPYELLTSISRRVKRKYV